MDEQKNNHNTLAKTLHKVEEAKRKLNYEVGTLISPDGKVIKEYIGGAHGIQIPAADKPLFWDNIFTHNHPNGRTFTVEDILEFAASGLFEVRVSTPQGTYFSLKESGEEINRSIGRVMQEEKVGSRKQATQIYEQRRITSIGIARDNKIYDIMGEEIDKWLSKNAEEFGYIYTKGEL